MLSIQSTSKWAPYYYKNNKNNDQYLFRTVRYPKSGETNPIAKLFVRQLSEEKSKEIIPPQKVLNWNEYIFTSVNWITENKLRYKVLEHV